MRSIILTIILVLLATLAYPAQVGVRITSQIPQHGHKDATDGGVLRVNGAYVQDTILTIPTSTTKYVNADTVLFDTAGIHSIISDGTNTRSRFTVPLGYSWANVQLNFIIPATTTTVQHQCIIFRDGVNNVFMFMPLPINSLGGGGGGYTGMMAVVAGSYFEVKCYNNDDANILSNMDMKFGITLYR